MKVNFNLYEIVVQMSNMIQIDTPQEVENHVNALNYKLSAKNVKAIEKFSLLYQSVFMTYAFHILLFY